MTHPTHDVDTPASRLDPSALRLIAVTDSLRDGVDGLAVRAAAAVAGGATMIQLRLRDEPPRVLAEAARALRAAVSGVPLLVCDRADVALAVDADGVHLASDELAAAVLRRAVPAGFLIGASVSDDADVGRAAGADYVSIGPVFATASGGAVAGDVLGIERFGALARACAVPAVAIGGVTPSNAGMLRDAGARGVAVISALFGSPEPAASARAFRAALDASER